MQKCNEHCSEKNNEFVQALNEKILKLINHLFCDTFLYNVQLTVINDYIGNCINLKNEDSTKCECKVKFKIRVSQELNNLLNLALKRNTNYQNTSMTEYLLSSQQNYLVAAIISIKGHPRFAKLYINWLLRRLKKGKETPRPIPQENYQPCAPYPLRNPELYVPYNDPEVLNYSNQISNVNYPSFDYSSSDNSPTHYSPTHYSYPKYKPFFGSSTLSAHDRRRNTNKTTYCTSSSYCDTNESDTIIQENDNAGVLQDNGGLVEDIDSSFDNSLWNDVFTCDCNLDDCDCWADIFSEILCNTECISTAAEYGCNAIGNIICWVIQALDSDNSDIGDIFDF